jgi:NADH-quinone oxidoreductase subunit F
VGGGRGPTDPPHYLVCNADESEPGTFKDRLILEHDPFSVIESMTIAGFATGCEHGYLYLRGEYPLAWERLVAAVTEARARGFLGQDIFGRGINFDIELRKGAGAYICGEETALFNSIEGYRGEPRNKPPFPVEHGLFDKPTVMNNVETLVNVPGIVLDGGQAYAQIGTRTRRARACSASRAASCGRAVRGPFGVTLRELLDMAGGVIDGRPLRAVLLGGAAGRFLTPTSSTSRCPSRRPARGREHGLGRDHGRRRHRRHAGDPDADRRVLPRRVVWAVRPVPRRDRAPGGGARAPDQRATRAARRSRSTRCSTEITASMRDSSICGLGQTAADAIESCSAQARCLRDGRSTMSRTRTGAPPRTVELEMNGETVEATEDQTILEVAQQQGIEIPTDVLGADAHARQRLPRLRGRAQGRSCPCAVVRAQGRGGHGDPDALGAREPQPQDGARVPRLVGRTSR